MTKFAFRPTTIRDVIVVDSEPFEDHRGCFTETYHTKKFADAGITATFVQENMSFSNGGVLRGLHYQLRHPQAKLVRVVVGEIFDVAVDIRRNSPTFGAWVGETLSESNYRQMFAPQGFAHGFWVKSDYAVVCYKCSDFYAPEDDYGICWNDEEIGIRWPWIDEHNLIMRNFKPVVSEKDAALPRLRSISHHYLPLYEEPTIAKEEGM